MTEDTSSVTKSGFFRLETSKQKQTEQPTLEFPLENQKLEKVTIFSYIFWHRMKFIGVLHQLLPAYNH